MSRKWHESWSGETLARWYHTSWAILCAGQGLFSSAYAWFSSQMYVASGAPAAGIMSAFWGAGAIMGLGGAVWHLAAGISHQPKRGRRG